MAHRKLWRWLEMLEDRLQPAVGGGFASAGLFGEYFSNATLTGPASFSRHDVRLDFDWGTNRTPGGSLSPAFSTPGADNFSARWSGQLLPRFSEIYTFHVSADDGVRLFVRPQGAANYTTVIDQWNAAGTITGDYALESGQQYDIVVEYREVTGPASLRVRWSSPSTPLEVIESPSAQGYNVVGREIFIFADAMKTARALWTGIGGGAGPGNDANGWPMGDAEMIVWEGAGDDYFSGTYAARFTGRATVNGFPGGDNGIRYRIPGNPTLYYSLTEAQIWNAATNTSQFEIVVPNHAFNSPYGFRVQNTRRLPGDTTATGITNLEIMRPRTIGGNDPYAFGTLFREDFKEAASVFTHFRWLDTNGNLSESEWSQRTSPAFGRATSPRNDGVVNKGWTYEYQIQFANETGKDLYLTVPMRASNDYFLQLARLIRYGSRADGSACTSDADPLRAYPGLNPNLKAYIEVANEVWNTAGGFEQTRQADDDAFAASQAPVGSAQRAEWDIVNYDGTLSASDPGGFNTVDSRRLTRWYALRTVRLSETFRGVFGDEMMTRVRPLLFWQYNNSNGTALYELKFLDDYFNNGGGNFVTTPRAVNYYLWGAGGASYYGSGNPEGRLAVDPIENASFDVTQGLPLNAATLRPNSVTGWSFLGNSGVIGRAPASGATFTSEGRTMTGVPNPATGDYAAYLIRNQGAADVSSISRTIHFADSGRYAIGFTLRYRSGWQYNVPLDFLLDGTRVTPQYLPYRGVGEADAASGPAVVAYSWNVDPAAFWSGQLTTATLQIDVPAGGRDVTFAVRAPHVDANPGDWNYQYQLDSYALFDGFYVGSVDRIFAAGMPNTGQANGQVGTGDWTRDRNQIAQYAQAYGLVPASYEAGFSLGGDGGASPLQNWTKYRDPRTKTVNDSAIDIHNQAGYGLVSWGVYEQWRDWDLANAHTAPLRQSFDAKNDALPAEATNGLAIPLALRSNQQSLGYSGSGTNWAYTRMADATLSTGEFLTWNILIPAGGAYSISAFTGNGGTVRALLDETDLASGASGSPLSDTRTLTPGLHVLKVRSVNGSFVLDRVEVVAVNAPAAPTLESAVDSSDSVTLAWTAVPGATGYRVRYGTSPNNYTGSLDAGNATSFVVGGLVHNQSYYFAVCAENAHGMSLPSNERSATPMAEGQLGNLAVWEFTGTLGGQATGPVTASTSRAIVSPITRGPGLSPSYDWVHQYFPNRFSSFSSNNLWAQTLAASITQGQYYQFTVAAAPGSVLSLDSLNVAAWFSHPEADCGLGLLYSTDGVNFVSLPATGTPNAAAGYEASLASLPALQNGTVTFRVHLYGPSSYTATGIGLGTSANDLTLRGSVKTIPAVDVVSVNNGEQQRSMVRRLDVTFNTLVNLGASPFEVRPEAGGTAIPLAWTSKDVNGRTVATIAFPGGSIADGRWRLTTLAAQVVHRLGGAVMQTNHSADFHRLFGDANGDATVDGAVDFPAFGNEFNLTSANLAFDFNDDGAVDGAVDFPAFGANFNSTL